jgi:hypothetical protein
VDRGGRGRGEGHRDPVDREGIRGDQRLVHVLERQAHYGGHPLYRYTGDISRGETDYIGTKQFGGFWHGNTAAAKAVR